MCACACVRVRVRVCACVCVRVCACPAVGFSDPRLTPSWLHPRRCRLTQQASRVPSPALRALRMSRRILFIPRITEHVESADSGACSKSPCARARVRARACVCVCQCACVRVSSCHTSGSFSNKHPATWKCRRKRNFSLSQQAKSYVCVCVSVLRAVCKKSPSLLNHPHQSAAQV